MDTLHLRDVLGTHRTSTLHLKNQQVQGMGALRLRYVSGTAIVERYLGLGDTYRDRGLVNYFSEIQQ